MYLFKLCSVILCDYDRFWKFCFPGGHYILIFLLAQYFGAEYDMVSSMSLAGILMLYDDTENSGKWMHYFIYFYFCHWNDCSFYEELEEKRRKSKLIPGEFLIESKWKKRIRQAFLQVLLFLW